MDSKHLEKIGMSPGQVIYTGKKTGKVKINLIKYNEQEVKYEDCENFDDLIKKFDSEMTNWINLDGVNDVNLMKEISGYFNFHSLMTEDIMNTDHLPKSDEYENHLFLTLKMMILEEKNGDFETIEEHLSLVLGTNYVISFQDKAERDLFDSVLDRIINNKGRIRKFKADYLFYGLLDSVVDHYFHIMEYVRESIENLEEFALSNPDQNITNEINNIRKRLTKMRKLIYWVKTAIEKANLNESELISQKTVPYFKDVLDHTIHLESNFENFRDSVASLMDMYMSNLSNNLNLTMKTLTIFSLFFVPLTFIAGVYGMNFQYMPELSWKWGYVAVLVVMLITVLVMFIFLRRKKWL